MALASGVECGIISQRDMDNTDPCQALTGLAVRLSHSVAKDISVRVWPPLQTSGGARNFHNRSGLLDPTCQSRADS